MFKNNLTAVLYSIAIIIAAFALGNAIINRNKPENVISVTGLGEINFTSDLIVWEGSFDRAAMDMKEASVHLKADKETIENYLVSKGIDKNALVFSSISVENLFNTRYATNGEVIGQEFAGYKLTQSVEITSSKINQVEEVSRNITELINDGIQLNSAAPRYYYTKLADLKLSLVSKATKDAKERAEKIAEESGSKIDKLTTAQMGIIQITGQNSGEDYSWGGAYNTSSREKTASITMKLNYRLD